MAGIGAFPERVSVSARIRVDEDFVAIVTETSLGFGRAADTKGIVRSRFQIFHKNVPKMKRFVLGGDQGDGLKGLWRIMLIKKQQFYAGCVPGIQREIHRRFAEWSLLTGGAILLRPRMREQVQVRP